MTPTGTTKKLASSGGIAGRTTIASSDPAARGTSKRQRGPTRAVASPQLRTPADRSYLTSPMIRQIIREGQQCQVRIRRYRRSGLVAWVEQAKRLHTIRNVHMIVGNAFERVADEIGLDSSTAFGLLQLHPFADRLLKECDERAKADPKFKYPGWRTALEWMTGGTPQPSRKPKSLAEAMRHIDRISAENAELQRRLSKAKYGKLGRGEQERETPQWLYHHFNEEFRFTCDAAASQKNHKHPNFFSKEQNALKQVWSGVLWLNPPWNEIGPFMAKAHEAAKSGATVVCLIPLWASEEWFLKFTVHGQIRILSDRVAFVGYDQKAPQVLCVIVLTQESKLSTDGRLDVVIERIQAPKESKKRGNASATSVSREAAE